MQFGLKVVNELPTLKEFEELARMEIVEPETGRTNEPETSHTTEPEAEPNEVCRSPKVREQAIPSPRTMTSRDA